MKKLIKLLTFIVSISMLSAAFSACSDEKNESTNSGDVSADQSGNNDVSGSDDPSTWALKSPISGTFIQPWLYGSWSSRDWEREIQVWDEMGIEYVIMGDTASYDLSTGKLTTAYPTSIEGATCSGDVVTKLFEVCKENGRKLFIGIGNTPAGWPYLDFGNKDNFEVFREVCKVYASIAEDVYNHYYPEYSDVFAGFYFVPEMYNSSMFDADDTRQTYVDGMAYGLNIIFEKLDELNPDLPFIFSPYLNIFGGSWVSKSSENIGKFWTEFLSQVNFRDGDILCPQDSVGAGGMDLEHLDEYTAMYKKATEECGKDIRFWSNCETFIQPKDEFFSLSDGVSYWGSASVARLVEQFNTVGKYAEVIVTFAFPHYQSPVNNVDGFYETFKDYLRNGKLETNAPTAPNKFRTNKTTMTINQEQREVLTVYWSGMYDDFGIWKVNIYKNGELLTYRYPTRRENGMAMYPNSFYDADYEFENETATYTIEVFDCAGNVSERVDFTVTPGSVPNNVTLDKTYTGPTD